METNASSFGTASHIVCEKCKGGNMAATTTARFSPALRFIGYTLLIPSLLLLLLTSGCAVVSCGSVAGTAVEQTNSATRELRDELAAIEGLTAAQREALLSSEGTAEAQEAAKAGLSDEQRQKVDQAYMSLAAKGAGAALGTGAVGLIGTFFFVAAYVVLIPLLIVGFVLTLTKKVWKCASCGYFYDRA